MKNFIKYSTLAFSVFAIASVSAQDYQHQLNASASQGVWDFGIGDGDDASMAVATEYRLGVNETFQLAFGAAYAHTEVLDVFGLEPGIILNFMGDLRNSVFLGAFYGWTRVKVDFVDATNRHSASVKAGKRFELVENVSYEPYVTYTYGFGDEFEGDRNDLRFTFLSLTATF